MATYTQCRWFYIIQSRQKKKKKGTCVGSKITMLPSSTPHLPCHRFEIGCKPACQVCVGWQLCTWTRLEHTKSERGTHSTSRHFPGRQHEWLNFTSVVILHWCILKKKRNTRARLVADQKYLKSWQSRYGKSSRKRVKTKYNDVKMLPQGSHTLPTALGSVKV